MTYIFSTDIITGGGCHAEEAQHTSNPILGIINIFELQLCSFKQSRPSNQISRERPLFSLYPSSISVVESANYFFIERK
jgi:hypothetical protein